MSADHTFRRYAVDLMSEAAGENLVDLYRRDGTPLPRTSEEEARERRAWLEHLAYLLDEGDYAELGRKLGPVMRAHIDDSIEAMREHEARQRARRMP